MMVLLGCWITAIKAQFNQHQADSLLGVLDEVIEDTMHLQALIQLGELYRDHKSAEAIEVLKEAAYYARLIHDDVSLAKVHATAGTAFGRLGKVDSARFYWQSSYQLLGVDTLSNKGGGLLNNLGMTEEMEGNLSEAVNYYERALLIFHSLNDTFGRAGISNNLGLVYKKQGNYQRAMESFLLALNGFEEIEHIAGQASISNNLGMIAQDQKSYVDALGYYKHSLQLKEKLEDKHSIAITLNNIGTLYKEQVQLDSARHYHQSSLDLKKEIADIRGQAISYNNLGELAIVAGDYRSGLELNKKAHALAESDPHTKAMAEVFIGMAYQKIGQSQEAKRWLLEAAKRGEQTGELSIEYDAKINLYSLFKNSNPKRALTYFEEATAIKDSLFNQENTRALTTLELEYAFEKEKAVKDQEISLLNSEKELAALQLRTAKRRNLTFGVLFLLLAVTSIILYRLFTRIKAQNLIIAQTLEERETLLKEIHHRVKNNLQVISSLLKLQSRSLSDETAVAALQEGQNRVRSMALIHQDLYQEDNLIGVSARQYIEKLCDGLFKSYNIKSDKISMQMDIDDVTLDVDNVIPLGLIINELVTNSLKYAFEDLDRGILSISLRQELKGLQLDVQDNGVGLPSSFSIQKTTSLGFRLIQAFATKLSAELNIEQGDGTHVSLFIPT
ncbi:MAG: tetratricopeptide repeat protein [Saprospiraceae bacterium]|nr:tetratricopeptide repeat protein [Saprospiraceae bacterium]